MNDYVKPMDQTRLAQAAEAAEMITTKLLDRPCENEEHKAWWSEVLSQVHQQWMTLDAERKNLVDPIVASQKEVNNTFRPALTALDAAKTFCKQRLANYAKLQEAKRTQAIAALGDAAASGDSEAITQAVAGLPEDSGTRWAWVPTVTKAEDVPDTYKIVDIKMLKAYAQTFKESENIPPIPGVAFTREPVMRAK